MVISLGLAQRSCIRTHPQTIPNLQAEIESATEEVAGDMLHDTVDNFVVRLQRVHEVEISQTENAFT